MCGIITKYFSPAISEKKSIVYKLLNMYHIVVLTENNLYADMHKYIEASVLIQYWDSVL
jgi:hypothetical protein